MSSVAAYEYWKDADLLIGIGSRLELQHFRWRCLPRGRERWCASTSIRPRWCASSPTSGIVDGFRRRHKRADRGAQPSSARARSREREFDEIKGPRRCRHSARSTPDELSRCDSPEVAAAQTASSSRRYRKWDSRRDFGFPVYASAAICHGGYQENLGFGFNTALGVKVAHPRQGGRVDHGRWRISVRCQELATAVQHSINLVTVVFNNSSYGNVRRDQIQQYSGRLLGADLVNPDFVKLVESFGIKALRAASPARSEVPITGGNRCGRPGGHRGSIGARRRGLALAVHSAAAARSLTPPLPQPPAAFLSEPA